MSGRDEGQGSFLLPLLNERQKGEGIEDVSEVQDDREGSATNLRSTRHRSGNKVLVLIRRALRLGPVLIAGVAVIAIVLVYHFIPISSGSTLSAPSSSVNLADFDPSQHSAVITNAPNWHEDVWMWMAGAIQKLGVEVMPVTECEGKGGLKGGEKPNDSCVRFGMMESALEAGVFDGTRYPRSEMEMRIMEPGANGKLPNVVFMTSEKMDMGNYHDRLLAMWHQRPVDDKFKLVPIFHYHHDKMPEYAKEWARLGALEYLTLGQNVAESLADKLDELSRDPQFADAALHHVKIHYAHPVINPSAQVTVTEPGELPRNEHNRPSRAVVVGKITTARRDYLKIFAELEAEFDEEADIWGYKLNDETQLYEAIDPASPDNFRLILLGEKAEHLDKGKLKNVIFEQNSDGQKDFYHVMAYADIQLLAWMPDSPYYTSQISGGIYRSLEVHVPMIIDPSIARAYPFLDESVVIKRSEAISDIKVIRWFRKYHDVDFQRMSDNEIGQIVDADMFSPPHKFLRQEIIDMLRAGWKRSDDSFDARRDQLAQHTRESFAQIFQEGL